MRIVSDSTADLPISIIKEYNVEIVPLRVHFGEEVFLDWIEMEPDKFYHKLTGSDILPRTSQPSPADFVKKYKEIGEGETIISIHISSNLSGTYQSAMMAKNMLPEMDIHVFDTKLASMAHGAVVMEAARAARENKSREEVLHLVKEMIDKVRVYFMVNTLEYLQKNGRIGRAQAMLGSLLKVKPILTLEEGIVTPKEKARGRSKALDRLVKICKDEFGSKQPVKIALIHGNVLEEVLRLKEMIEGVFNFEEAVISDLGAVIGSHTGPGVVGIVMYPHNDYLIG
ncbi:MAG: DegV family protein [Candidatus Syntrophonatronum acetioxidans]|uniref:DegV family protein n=1 Tax=Candidatus Syntrophonatronum acetioxidans TaxID=1795816 RepID=A0A424YHW6_9FIRM|nr:MAG: DegV family protein [Candidatus Syntrophonatronum acetioxidans]